MPAEEEVEEFDSGLMGVPAKEYIASIRRMVNELDEQSNGSPETFGQILEESMLEEVDRRSRELLRAEEEGVVKHARGPSIFTQSIEQANEKIADLRSRIDGRPAAEHLEELHREARQPKEGFIASLVRRQDERIQQVRARIAKEEGETVEHAQNPTATRKEGGIAGAIRESEERIAAIREQLRNQHGEEEERSPRERDDLQQARSRAKAGKEEELTPEEQIARTREKIRITELKLQAYHSLTKILKAHIVKIEKVIKEDELSQDEVDRLNKFRNAVEKFDKKIGILGKEKKNLTKEQEENLTKQKITRYRELEEQMKAKRKALEAAERAERAAGDDRNYAGFVLPGDFLRIVKEEQQQAAASRSDAREAEVRALAERIEQAGSGPETQTKSRHTPAVEEARQTAMSAAAAGRKAANQAATVVVPEKLFEHTERPAQLHQPPPTPVTEAARQRKQAARDIPPGYYERNRGMKNKGSNTAQGG